MTAFQLINVSVYSVVAIMLIMIKLPPTDSLSKSWRAPIDPAWTKAMTIVATATLATYYALIGLAVSVWSMFKVVRHGAAALLS